jgi:colanic acid/amylovoran biosynthesis glycosyltransferase
MILGRRVLSTYIGGIPEVLIDGKAGWLFPAGSEEDLLTAVRICLDTPKEVFKKIVGARAPAFERHDLDNQAEKLASMFKSVLHEQGAQCL